MGYFSNGTSGALYEEQYCANCIHGQDHDKGCAVWDAHLVNNYDECNNEKSILHQLIPRDGVDNKKCLMFMQVEEQPLFSEFDKGAPTLNDRIKPYLDNIKEDNRNGVVEARNLIDLYRIFFMEKSVDALSRANEAFDVWLSFNMTKSK
jgi:hypothetical protein